MLLYYERIMIRFTFGDIPAIFVAKILLYSSLMCSSRSLMRRSQNSDTCLKVNRGTSRLVGEIELHEVCEVDGLQLAGESVTVVLLGKL